MIQEQLSELIRDMMSTVELIKEDADLLSEGVTEVALCSLERNVQTLREEFGKAAVLEEELEFKRHAEDKYGTL